MTVAELIEILKQCPQDLKACWMNEYGRPQPIQFAMAKQFEGIDFVELM